MYRFAAGGPIDVEELRERVRRITADQLLRCGKAAAYMCTPKSTLGRPPRESVLIQAEQTARNGGDASLSIQPGLRGDSV